jgi:transcription-repair coupling factor (superfamily II helicase)
MSDPIGADSATASATPEAAAIPFRPGDLVVHLDHGLGRFQRSRMMGDQAKQVQMARAAWRFTPASTGRLGCRW